MNTHRKYNTVSHHHFDFTFMTPEGGFDYPDSGLMLVECDDGRWFIEQEFGQEYSQFPGVVKSREDLETEPTFYKDLETVAQAAFSLIKLVYPTTPDTHFTEFFGE